jgi:acyl-CoA synthetase (AMP-forming)/AMP-acid ligase II
MENAVFDLIARHPDDAPALGAPGQDWMSFGALRAQARAVVEGLRAAGLGAGDRVAIVLPNGPEMAAAFVCIASGATAAPLNPAYREEEFDFYLSDLRAKLLVVADGYDGPALAVAERRGIEVRRLTPAADGPAGAFALDLPEGGEGRTCGAEDEALVLHTSGTTSRPKIVPLLQRNLAASARHIGEALALTERDRCLNMMPLFHIHGLVAATLSSLAAGGAVWCAPGFDAIRVFGWMQEAEPTWYTAVPTMHQAILGRAPRNREVVEGLNLRLIRSSSASLPAQVMTRLAETFGCPVIESYGMTEAAHQMTSNPLDRQKPGSVGVPAGPEVRTAHETENRLLEGGALGEVVISGPNVTPGYEGNPEANAKSFFEADGKRWFRTGDQGAFDEDGFLRITGRLKEIINRGGEKVSPLEVDDALMDHPAVAQAVTFAMPHPKLGEEVAAAVVLREGETADEAGLRAFVRERLADFKTPRRVVILDEIPKGATGKLQRIGLADKLGLGG